MTMRSSCNIHAGARRIARPQGGRRAPAVGRVHPAGRRQNAGRRPRHPRRACAVHERYGAVAVRGRHQRAARNGQDDAGVGPWLRCRVNIPSICTGRRWTFARGSPA